MPSRTRTPDAARLFYSQPPELTPLPSNAVGKPERVQGSRMVVGGTPVIRIPAGPVRTALAIVAVPNPAAILIAMVLLPRRVPVPIGRVQTRGVVRNMVPLASRRRRLVEGDAAGTGNERTKYPPTRRRHKGLR